MVASDFLHRVALDFLHRAYKEL
uniref:Uncharacterized protein n=1 Tax=Rhizophora mucronata TaxID=61149 RepID=A0A2P2MXM9_RHIMU